MVSTKKTPEFLETKRKQELTQELDKILHQPIRTRIMALLATQQSCDYVTLKKLFALSDGHMTTHMRELLSNNYVLADKLFVDNKPKTIYSITPEGKKAFTDYIHVLRNIIIT